MAAWRLDPGGALAAVKPELSGWLHRLQNAPTSVSNPTETEPLQPVTHQHSMSQGRQPRIYTPRRTLPVCIILQ